MTISTQVRVELGELVGEHKECWTYQHENFCSFLTDKVADKLERELDCFQIMCYSIVDHEHDAVIFEVEGYEDK